MPLPLHSYNVDGYSSDGYFMPDTPVTIFILPVRETTITAKSRSTILIIQQRQS
jgi:hypothetical protein